MSINHLSDDQIQEYLDGLSSEVTHIHLEKCAACRENLKAYQNLYKHLQGDTPFELPSDFEDKVMSNIRGQSETANSGLLTFFLSLLGVAGAFFTIFYYYGLNFLKAAPENFILIVDRVAKELNGGLTLIVAAALILILLGIVDRNIARVRSRIS